MTSNTRESNNDTGEPKTSLVSLTYIIYALHLFSAVTGVISSAFIVTAFLTGWPSLLAIVLSYIKRSDTQGTYLQSHFTWQIRTFWFSLLWLVIAAILALTVIAIPLAFFMVIFVGIWVMYRIIRGLLRLINAQPMPL
jgi:uncharacterized membrane protein